MDFIDSFTQFHEQPPADLVRRHYEALNDFLARKNDHFLDHWHDGPEATLFFTFSERERGGQAVRDCLSQVRAVLSRVPVGTTLKGLQITYQEHGDMAFAATMEQAISNMDKKTVVTEQRTSLMWRRVHGHWKLFVMHCDDYSRREEAMSEMLRAYEKDACVASTSA